MIFKGSRNRFGFAALIGVSVAAMVSGSGHASRTSGDATSGTWATTTLRDAAGHAIGKVGFSGWGRFVHVSVRVRLPADSAEFHGFHIHANDNPANGSGCVADPQQPSSTWFASVDGHWNPGGETHGHHDGDLPTLMRRADGTAEMHFRLDKFAVRDVLARAVIVHTGPDNVGNVPLGDAPNQYTANSQAAIDATKATGNAGNRFACGVLSGRRHPQPVSSG
ncbi:superoxide dismutase family protein [Amycolatopsis cihanbeyliensis]|uniref:Cu-Zn family superoxide dismutase n=1 Tax=Amycolatopsis cihanbeyliensis TaxID=1128664 RepID=A0A542DBM6_AMYCI|nr:superoxide dismutase family protein [Amycolatopsis cihanbeyliensis]TQJ00480.1 Cu-Zn family superoxide dismutase [Amycolatopsis cihanbeyliensis]